MTWEEYLKEYPEGNYSHYTLLENRRLAEEREREDKKYTKEVILKCIFWWLLASVIVAGPALGDEIIFRILYFVLSLITVILGAILYVK